MATWTKLYWVDRDSGQRCVVVIAAGDSSVLVRRLLDDATQQITIERVESPEAWKHTPQEEFDALAGSRAA